MLKKDTHIESFNVHAHKGGCEQQDPPPGDLPNPVMEPMSFISALAGGFFTTWEAQ